MARSSSGSLLTASKWCCRSSAMGRSPTSNTKTSVAQSSATASFFYTIQQGLSVAALVAFDLGHVDAGGVGQRLLTEALGAAELDEGLCEGHAMKPGEGADAHGYANNNPYRFTDPDGRQSVGEMIDSAAEGCGAVSCAGYAVLSAAWKVLGAEGASQIADKGWSNTSGVGKAGAVLEVAAVLPPIKLLRGAEVAVKEAVPAIKGMTGHAVDQAINRGVKPIQILDAVKNPLKVAEVKVDALGRASQKVVGQTATVIVNPTTSKVVTIYPTSTKVAEKLMKETE